MLLKRNFKRVSLLLLGITLVISTPGHSKNEISEPHTIQIQKADLNRLKQSVLEWENTQPNVEKLLQLEKKLIKLAQGLKKIDERHRHVHRTAHTIFNEGTILKNPQAIFALQVAAFKNKNTLQKAFVELTLKASNITQQTLIANTEPTIINSVIFYRLKLGAYQSKVDAQSDCSILKRHKINCFVSYYVEQAVQ